MTRMRLPRRRFHRDNKHLTRGRRAVRALKRGQ